MTKEFGILMPVSSLPNRFGSGDFGPQAYRFVDDIKNAGFKIWQILPLNPLGFGNSPYQPFSSFAMDELYLSLDMLKKDGLLDSVPDTNEMGERVDYEQVKSLRHEYLQKAFANFKPDEAYRTWVKQQKWLRSYEIFMAFKTANQLRSWTEWPKAMRDYPETKAVDLKPYQNEIHYQRFVQYLLYCQWNALKDYANKKGIKIMGDIPFYVGLDSADCWSNRPNFLLTKTGKPRFIAGVPPDYFSAIGQRWGNPIYNWDYMKKDGFRFWLNRIAYTSRLFDITRLDHFRAFDTYWKIPASCPTAIEGKWIEAPGYAFFDKLFKQYPDIEIIAEDLGDLREEVHALRDHYHFRGMNILQFTFNASAENRVPAHCLAYTGTHDNETIQTWFDKMPEEGRHIVTDWLRAHGYEAKTPVEQFLKYTLDCGANFVIIPMTDWLELGEIGTINRPGTIGSPNWEWRMPSFEPFEERLSSIREMLKHHHHH